MLVRGPTLPLGGAKLVFCQPHDLPALQRRVDLLRGYLGPLYRCDGLQDDYLPTGTLLRWDMRLGIALDLLSRLPQIRPNGTMN